VNAETLADPATLELARSELIGADPGAMDAVMHAQNDAAFGFLGRHGTVLRALLPDALADVEAIGPDGDVAGRLARIHPDGMFAGTVITAGRCRLRYVSAAGEIITEDCYQFGPVLGDIDLYLLGEGKHQDMAMRLGAHPDRIDGIPGTRFAVWAPNARRVSVVGEFNAWDGRRHQMRRAGAGIWEIFLPGIGSGALYKYEILGPDGMLLPLKADPVAWRAQRPPATASIVADDTKFHWTDDAWMRARLARKAVDAPISVYEVHAGSWMLADADGADGWDRLAHRLVPYVHRMGFTHVEFLPVMEHPFGGSWGYQPLGQFAPMAEMGAPDAFARMIDVFHAHEIGVILDWVPAHFPSDAHGLARFDGTALYEHQDPREGYHQDWNTLIYNLGRFEVRGFLVASALHWLEHFHADGLRVDAVASMLYRDYSRKTGEWIPNKYGGRENLEAVEFLQHLSRVVHQRCPGTVLIAEESTAWPGVTRSPDQGGLGFDYKWNMGWMHDTLHYMADPPIYRRWVHDHMTFGLVYAWSENYILPISHDEVVHGKGSLIGRMPGDSWQRFANLRAYLGFMFTHPGKKLLFMGCEFGQEREWGHQRGLDWSLLQNPAHEGTQILVRDLNALYRNNPALYRRDASPLGFSWVVLDDREQSVFAWLRSGDDDDPPCLVVVNFTPVPRYCYRIGVPRGGRWAEVMNTDAAIYGGGNIGNAGALAAEQIWSHGREFSLVATLPPLATVVFRLEG
jgi:1,4-alpha-glucan branching enzyme